MKSFAGLLLGIFVVALILNLVWENAQMPLYQSLGTFWRHFPICVRASLFDASYITVLYLGMALVNKDMFWLRQRETTNYLIVIGVSLLVAWWIEFDALRDGRWAYNERMPVVFGAGLTPLAQLSLLSVVTYEVVRRLRRLPFIQHLYGQRDSGQH